ncbi:MAG: hypothetical protein ACYCZY_03635 [Lacisediminihabitans sp.]
MALEAPFASRASVRLGMGTMSLDQTTRESPDAACACLLSTLPMAQESAASTVTTEAPDQNDHECEDRDGMLASGMEGGLSEGFERLDEVLAASAR